MSETPNIRSLESFQSDPPEWIEEHYGTKVLGVAQLVQMRAELALQEAHYQVPNGFGVPKEKIVPVQLRYAFHQFTQGHQGQPFLVRSSAYREPPGKNRSEALLFTPSNRFYSTLGMLKAYDAVVADEPKGVLIQWMAASKGDIEDYDALDYGPTVIRTSGDPRAPRKQVWGSAERSFFVHSHSTFDPSRIQIAVVQGLAMGVADGEVKPILIDVDGQTGMIKMVLEGDDYQQQRGKILDHGWRQKDFYYYDPQKGVQKESLDYKNRINHPVYGGDFNSFLGHTQYAFPPDGAYSKLNCRRKTGHVY